MKLPRFMHKIYANINGYYWLPCIICGEYHGGHEYDIKKSGVLYTRYCSYTITCHKCKSIADRLNALYFKRQDLLRVLRGRIIVQNCKPEEPVDNNDNLELLKQCVENSNETT